MDNTQNEDWREVELSLVSGASNSFIYDLYNPRFAARTEVSFFCKLSAQLKGTILLSVKIEVEQEETLAPPVLEDAVAQHDVSALKEATAVQNAKPSKAILIDNPRFNSMTPLQCLRSFVRRFNLFSRHPHQ